MGTPLQDLAGSDNNPQDVQEMVNAAALTNEARLLEERAGGGPNEQPPPSVESRASEQKSKPFLEPLPAHSESHKVDLEPEDDDLGLSEPGEGLGHPRVW